MTATEQYRTVAADWISMYIFYSSEAKPLLSECIAPLVDELRRRQLIHRYFFIRYWQEGMHVRLRLLPRQSADTTVIRDTAQHAVDTFLRRRPALPLQTDDMGTFFQDMFIAEYGPQEWERQYGRTGMRARPTNTYTYCDYLPEYDRYGGPAGIELAEWHFEASSDLIIRLLSTTNVHLRTVLYGLSAQLSVTLGLTFLGEPTALADFFENYSTFWMRTYPDHIGDDEARDRFDRAYDRMTGPLNQKIDGLTSALLSTDRSQLARFVRDWADHCGALRESIRKRSRAGELIFPTGPDKTARAPLTDPSQALRALLGGYIHMTNNRLGVGIHDEAYLAYLLRRSLREIYGAHQAELGKTADLSQT